MERYSCGNVNATFHFAVSYCVVGETKKTAVDYGTASLDIERERICIEAGDFLTRLRIANTSGTMLKLMAAYPILTDDLSIGGIPSWDWRVYNGSRQLNDVPATCILGEKDHSFAQASDRLHDEGMPRRDFTSGDKVLYGDGITIIKAGKTYVSLEIITNENQLTDISISTDCKGDVKAIRLGGEFNCLMDTDEVIYTDWVRVSVGGNFIRLIDDYAMQRRAMCEIESCRKDSAVYRIDGDISADAVSERLAFLRSLRAPFDYVEIGKKWYSKIGDWEAAPGINKSHLAGLINKNGYKAGIWTSPFLADKDSELVETEKSWLLRHADGSLCTYEADGKVFAVLDVSSPDCLEWLSMLYKSLSASGFYMHHIDHTMAFAIQKDVILRDPKLNIAKAYRNAMQVIKRAIGDEGYMHVTNGFMPMLCGVADSVQICSDIDKMQNSGSCNIIPKLVNQCALRSYTASWWNNVCGFDIDSEFAAKYSPAEKKCLLTCQYISGSPAVVSDITTNEQLKALRCVYPPVAVKSYVRDAFCDSAYISAVDVEVNDSYHTVCFFNNSFADAELSFRLDSNTCGGYVDHASQYNISTYFGRARVYDCTYDDIIKLGTIPANSCEIVKIAKSDRPQIMLSDMHFSMGGELEIDLDGSCVRAKGRNLFNCRGNYVVALPKDMQCVDGKREFSFTVNGEGDFVYEKQIRKVNSAG